MRHTGTVPLDTPRLLLRRFEEGDAGTMFRNWASREAVARFMTWPPHDTVDGTRSLLRQWVQAYGDDVYNWAVVLKESGEPVGSISVVHLYEWDQTCEIGYCIGDLFWGRGLMTEAARAVIAHLFETVECNRVQAVHIAQNPASGAVMEKAGMTYEGTLRERRITRDGTVSDLRQYAILRGEWKAGAGRET